MTQDTWAGSAWAPWTQNLYTYVGNNPVNFVDPTGHVAWSLTVGGNLAIIIGVRVDVGVAWDDHGNIGLIGDVGFVKGVAVGVGVEGSAYTVDTIDDLRGGGSALGYSLVVAGGEFLYDAEGNYVGGGVNVGKGLAVAVYHTNMYTVVGKLRSGKSKTVSDASQEVSNLDDAEYLTYSNYVED